MHSDTANGKYILFTFLKSVTSLSSSFPFPETWEGKEREPQRPTPNIQRRTPWLTPANQSERDMASYKAPGLDRGGWAWQGGSPGRKRTGVGRSAEGLGKQSNVLPSSSLCTPHLCWGAGVSLYPSQHQTPCQRLQPLTVRSLDTKYFCFVVS